MSQQIQAARQPAQAQPVAGRILQRVCACGKHAEGGECAECKQKRLGTLQRAAVSADPGGAEAPPIVHAVLRSPGQPLDDATRAFMEPRFGHDFSPLRSHATARSMTVGPVDDAFEREAETTANRAIRVPTASATDRHDFGSVRVHTDARAAEAAQAVNAAAFTVGNNIAFGPGRYAPSTTAGRRLLAHELVHVLQQTQTIRRQPEQPKVEAAPEAAKEPEELQLVREIESNWADVKDAASFKAVQPWVRSGDAVIALLRTHSTATLSARQSGDTHLFSLYQKVVESDKAMYVFIAWHTVYYANLLSIKSQSRRIVESFDADDRQFTNRADAEALARMLPKLIELFEARAAERLKNVSTSERITVKRPGMADLQITATNAYQDKNQAYFRDLTSDTIQAQADLQVAVTSLNAFLANARREGAQQMEDAVKQYFQMRGQGKRSRGPKVKRDKSKGKQGDDKKKSEEKKTEEKKSDEKKESGSKRRGRWGCDDVRCNVYPNKQADEPNANCPERVIGTSRGHSSYAEACLAAQRDANSQVPRGCIKRHCNCTSKCRKM